MSCVPIYNIHNVTLWSCPINRNVILAEQVARPANNTPSSSSGGPSPSRLSGPAPNLWPSPAPNVKSGPAPSRLSNPAPSRLSGPSPNLRSSPSPKVICQVVQINNTNHSVENATESVACACPSHLEWLSLLAIIPLFCICACLWVKKRRAGLRIGNIYIPKITRRMRRSRSWPQLPTNLTNSPIDNRSRSEPVFDSIVL